MPVDEALALTKQIAEALEAAHEIGIMHRDLKPANVMITPDGKVKVLDFGLAKALVGESSQTDLGNSPTITAEHTRPGVVLGTAAYMSPEQARGKPLDKRTDIWSFGCVLYECLTGKHTFSGETTSDLIAQILERDPDFDALPVNTPVAVRHMLMRCLEKDRQRRLRDIGDAVLDLDEAISTRSWSTAAMAAAQDVPSYERRSWRGTLFAIALVALGAVAGAAAWQLTSPVLEQPISRVSIVFPSHMKVVRTEISPDGQTLAWTARPRKTGDDAKEKTRIYTRRLDSFDAQPVNGTEGTDSFLFSYDGRWFHFLAPVSPGSDKLRLAKVPVDGSSPPLTLADWRDDWGGFLTLPGGDVLVQLVGENSFVRIPGAGGPASAPVEIDKNDFEAGMDLSQALPRDDAVLLDWYRWGPRGYEMGVAILDLDTGTARILLENGGHAAYTPTGHLLFSRGDTLLAAPFNLDTLEVTGSPVAIAGGIRTDNAWENGEFMVSQNGTLVYAPGGRLGSQRKIVLVDSDGNVEPWSAEGRRFAESVSVSRDGRRLAVTVSDAAGKWEIWTSDLDRPRLRQFAVATNADCCNAIWSPDGERIAYRRIGRNDEDGVYVRNANGSGTPQRLVTSRSIDSEILPMSWSPDGSHILVLEIASGRAELSFVSVEPDADGKHNRQRVTTSSENKGYANLSPDGKWLSYMSDDSGRLEAYVCPFHEDGTTGPGIPVSTDGGGAAKWSTDGKTLYYVAQPDRLMAVSITTEPAFSASRPRKLFHVDPLRIVGSVDYLPDGRCVAIQKGEDEGEIKSVNVVLNWFEELKRRVPTDP